MNVNINQIVDTLIHKENMALSYLTPMHGLAIVLSLMLLLVLIRFSKRPTQFAAQQSTENYDAIAGDNTVTTKLDLARAYIEMDKKHLAKNILYQVKKQGTSDQREQAKKLLSTL